MLVSSTLNVNSFHILLSQLTHIFCTSLDNQQAKIDSTYTEISLSLSNKQQQDKRTETKEKRIQSWTENRETRPVWHWKTFAMASQSQGWRGPDFKFLSTGISCTCLITRQTNVQTHWTLTSPITYNGKLFHQLTSRSKMWINRPSKQVHTKENLSSTICISKRVYPPLIWIQLISRSSINLDYPLKSRNQKSRRWKYYYHGTEIPEEDYG
jgi:hypothetical protein